MLQVLTDSRMLDHRPPEGHPEKPERLAAILRELRRTGQFDRLVQGSMRVATDEELLRVHSASHLRSMAVPGDDTPAQVETDTWISAGSELAARLAVGSVLQAVELITTTQTDRVFCLVRPPGHHARVSNPMGFCLYGSIAVAAADAIERFDLERVLIIDWDVHHGNGTQEMFYDDPRIHFFSIHRYPFYPGSGAADETGTGRGLGSTMNVPIRYGTSRAEYLAIFRQRLEKFTERCKPQLILISAGFDAHIEDPVGNLGLENEDYSVMTNIVKGLARQYTGGRFVSVLEGGYNPSILAGCVSQHLDDLETNE